MSPSNHAALVSPSMAPPGVEGASAEAFHEEAERGDTPARELLAWLWRFAPAGRGALTGGLVAAAVGMTLSAARPLIMGGVVAAAEARDSETLGRRAFTLALTLVSVQLLAYLQNLLLAKGSLDVTRALREHVFARMLRIPMGTLDRTPTARLTLIATSDIQSVFELLGTGALASLLDLVLVAVLLVAMLVLDWHATLAVLVVVALLGLIVALCARRSRVLFADVRVKLARLTTEFVEQIEGVTLVQSLRRERRMAREVSRHGRAWEQSVRRSAVMDALVEASVETASILAIAALVAWTGLASRGGRVVPFALVVTFTSYVYQAFEPFRRLTQASTLVQRGLAGLERAYLFCRDTAAEAAHEVPSPGSPGAPAEPAEPLAPTSADEGLVLEHVTFGYAPGEVVLRDMILRVRQGERVAIVGKTGSGKSTLTRLLLRYYEANLGSVRVLGHDVRTADLRRLRATITLVSQDAQLVEGTLAENVAPDPATFDRARVESVLEHVGAAELFARRGGTDAPIEPGGENLSAGERQLVALARAVYRDTPVVLLDEATANLDPRTEKRLRRGIARALEGRTAIVVAHRLETVRALDRVMVVDRGRVVEVGTHDELRAAGGPYAALCESELG